MTYSLEAIASYIFYKKEKCTNLQLNKLAYIAYGMFIAHRGKKLFDARIESWKYGPMIPELYSATKHWGKYYKTYSHEEPKVFNNFEQEYDKNYLDELIEYFDTYTGIQLSTLCHQPGSAWDKINSVFSGETMIPDELIRQEFEKWRML